MAPYVTPAEVKAEVPSLVDFDDLVIATRVTEFEEVAEDYLGVAFTPREAIDTFTLGYGSAVLALTYPALRSVTSAAVEDVEVSAASYAVQGDGLVLYGALGLPGRFLTVTYQHGLDGPPQALKRACWLYVRAVLKADSSGVSRDVITQSFEGGTTRYSTPDKKAGRPTGYIEIDRLLNNLPSWAAPKIAG